MENVNKQLLEALAGLLELHDNPAPFSGKTGEERILALEGQAAKRNALIYSARQAIAAAEQAQQTEPVAWHTNDPCVSGEHIEAIAKVCKIIPSYTTVEYVDRIVGFGHVLLADKSVQEAFVRANSHLLRADAAQPPAVAGAVPGAKRKIGTLPVKDRHFLCHCEKCGWIGSSEECRESINHMYGDGDYYCPSCGANGPDEMHEAEATFNAMLAAAPQAAVAAPLPPYNVFSDDDGDSWREHPADADFVEGLQLGEEFELLAGWRAVRVTFRVTKVPDDESDDYEVEEVTAPAAAQKGGQ